MSETAVRNRDKFDEVAGSDEPILPSCLGTGPGCGGLIGLLFVFSHGRSVVLVAVAAVMAAVFAVFGLRQLRPLAYLAAIGLILAPGANLTAGVASA